MAGRRTLTPTTLTVRHLEHLGYVADVVERRTAMRTTHDLFGMFDVVAIKGDETLAVQCTDATNVSARIKKLTRSINLSAVREAGWRIEVHGWYDDERVRVVDVS